MDLSLILSDRSLLFFQLDTSLSTSASSYIVAMFSKMVNPAARIALLVASLSGLSNAFWRMDCHSRTGLARIDPLVDPGVVSDHSHAIHGGNSKSLGLYLLQSAHKEEISSQYEHAHQKLRNLPRIV